MNLHDRRIIFVHYVRIILSSYLDLFYNRVEHVTAILRLTVRSICCAVRNEVEMNEEANTEVIRDCYQKFTQGDISGLLEHFADDVDLTVPEVENAPYGGIWHGRKEVEKFFDLIAHAEELNDYEAREFIASGDRVIVLGRSTATVKATGRHYSTEWVHVHTLRNKMITSFVEFFDTAAALRAFQKVTSALK